MTQGFAGDVGVVPRQFLRQLVLVFDLVDQEPDFDIATALKFEPRDSTPEEEARRDGRSTSVVAPDEPDDGKAYLAPVLDW